MTSRPRRLSRALAGQTVSTVVDAGWSGVKNGKLLSLAAGQFDVFVTADRNLHYQQNLAALPLTVVLLIAHDNRLPTLLPLVPELLVCLAKLMPNSLVRVGG